MTNLLAQAFQKASQLPENLQDELASALLEEIEWESRWDKTLADSQDKLDQLAQKALDEYQSGKTKEMGFDEL
ncbi:MAG: hypothetical protein ABSE63_08805 [Thermoguttaceae bacterium]|jgi:hypothetical protein